MLDKYDGGVIMVTLALALFTYFGANYTPISLLVVAAVYASLAILINMFSSSRND